MNRDSRWKYILLGTGALLVIIVLVYLQVAAYFNVPVVSLLPSNRSTNASPVVTPLPNQPNSLLRFTSNDGIIQYNVRGRFVTDPTYNQQNLLQSNFVIDGDPLNHEISFVMTAKDRKINVGRYKGSLSGTATYAFENTESLRQSIKMNAPAQLRLRPLSTP